MKKTKKLIILSEKTKDGEDLRGLFLENSKLDVLILNSEEEVLDSLHKEKEQIYALILIMDELEILTINNFGRHLHLASKNPDLNFLAVIKNTKKLDFEVFFYNFPLITVDFTDVQSLPERMNGLKSVA